MSSLDNQYWRSFDQLEGAASYQEKVDREFPEGAAFLEDDMSRRTFLKLLGATTALAGLTGCSIRRPEQYLEPYSKLPEHIVPGESVYFATGMAIGEEVVGILAETYEGRPTKIEGNPEFPTNKGAASAFHQASILSLYDPDRVQTPLQGLQHSSLEAFNSFLSNLLQESPDGEGMAILTETSLSPTFTRLCTQVKKKMPKLSIFRYEPINRDAEMEGIEAVSGKKAFSRYNFEKANIILSFDHDFLGADSSELKDHRDFSARRDPDNEMNRLYVFESSFSMTGAKADHRIRIKSSDIEKALWQILVHLNKKGLSLPFDLMQLLRSQAVESVIADTVLEAITEDLLKNKKSSLVLSGRQQPASVHALVYLLNDALGNINHTVFYHVFPFSQDYFQMSHLASISKLSSLINEKKISSLFILGGDPAYNAPSDLNFSQLLKQVKNTVHLTSHVLSTSQEVSWVLPRSHYLESWSDLSSLSGHQILCQPVIKPLYDSLNDIEFLGLLLQSSSTALDFVKETHSLSESALKKALHEGILRSNAETKIPSWNPLSGYYSGNSLLLSWIRKTKKTSSSDIELVFKPSSSVFDGRFVNNGWLQELPDPITKLTWDNALLMSMTTAKKIGVKTGRLLEITDGKSKITAAVKVIPGQADNSLLISLGYGQNTTVGRVGGHTGFNAYPLRTTLNMHVLNQVTLTVLPDTYTLATTQEHGSMEGRPLVREATLSHYQKEPNFAQELVEVPEKKSLYPDIDYSQGYQWGMAIDLAKCTGCNACITACQSENNIPTVGKSEVLRGRELHWIRIDRYFEGDADSARMVEQPMTCLQCETAPCEQVCPVAATVHSKEGLNDMVYNRCIGTKYCADNCPVKVRRFNFFDYHQRNPQSKAKNRVHFFDYFKEPEKTVQMQFNPDVTIRMRGVMEKCTYCVQRINKVRIKRSNESLSIQDGDIKTACEQTCPSQAIVFGNILDEKSKVFQLKKKSRNYEILENLYLKARTTYLASVRNPHPKLLAWEEKRVA